eukprot:3761464-Prymnesium_polylepis.1
MAADRCDPLCLVMTVCDFSVSPILMIGSARVPVLMMSPTVQPPASGSVISGLITDGRKRKTDTPTMRHTCVRGGHLVRVHCLWSAFCFSSVRGGCWFLVRSVVVFMCYHVRY